MKNIIIFMTTLFSLVCFQSFGQISSPSTDKAKNNFTIRMNNHIAKCLDDPEKMAKATTLFGHTCDKNHTVTPEEIKARAAEAEKHAFIQSNMDEYMKVYFPQTLQRLFVDTFICDNGGFEDDFLFYKGFVAQFTHGSNTCTPNVAGWTPVTLPTPNRIEIVNSGTDPLVGLQQTLFGNKALRLNSKNSHSFPCVPQRGVDRIQKRFKVTEENRIFTVWFALALENPSGHDDRQPFFNMRCDKAPADELCFDADILINETKYPDPACNYDSIVTLDWACHRFRMPTSEIGNIATLEIIVGDCGQGGHFGYAYIDGICEPCNENSSFGSVDMDPNIQYYSCDGLTATICGSYNLPSFCSGCQISNLSVPGYNIQNIEIDHVNQTYCFDFPVSNFINEDCIDIFTELIFSYNGSSLPPQPSNPIEICPSDFNSYNYTATVGQCYDNGTDDIISDDYYFVTVDISDPKSNGWILRRQLTDPYPNESGIYTHATGSGSTTVVLGPFLIQEGCWRLLISLPGCEFDDLICPPDFCSGCEELRSIKIGNVQCSPARLGMPSTWSFDLQFTNSMVGSYEVTGGGNSYSGNYNTVNTISGLPLGNSCINFEIVDDNNDQCKATFTVCPPKPCQPFPNECDLELVVQDVECLDKDGSYIVTLDIWNTGSDHLCYSTDPPSSLVLNSVPANGQLGPFIGDVTLVIYSCNGADCSNCVADNCYKIIKVFKPDCKSGHFDPASPAKISDTKEIIEKAGIQVIPNPINQQEVRILSSLDKSSIEIYNSTAILVHKTHFIGSEYRWNMSHLSAGSYFVKYHDGNGNIQTIKFLKL